MPTGSYSYKGIGHIPKDLNAAPNPRACKLLNQLPKVLRAYGKAFSKDNDAAVVVVVDLDKRDCLAFKRELQAVLEACDPRPKTLFRIAIEEGEAWLLGDRNAIKTAFPRANDRVLDDYVQDSICDTWEKLADAIHPGGVGAD